MAFGTTTQWAAGTAHDYKYRDGFVDAVFRNNSLLGLFPTLPAGDSSYRWKVNSAGNTNVAVFTEGASAAVPVAQTYVNAAVSYTYLWGWIRVSGHIRDVMRNGGAYAGLPLIQNEFLGTTEDLRDLATTSAMGSTYGLEVAVDSTTTYAGISRGSAAYFESSETAHNATLTMAGLANITEACEDNDKGGKTGLILTARNQLTNYMAFSGTPNTANHSFRSNAADLNKPFDIQPSTMNLTFQGIPIVGLPDWTDEVWMGLDMRPTRVGPNVGISIARDFEIRGPDMAGDDDVWEVSTAFAVIVHSPKLCWKLTGVTA